MINHIAENIKALRANKGLSQEQLAEIAEVTQNAVSAWEQGKNSPRYSNALNIVSYFEELDNDALFSDSLGYAKHIGGNGSYTAPSFAEVPLYGFIAAGTADEMIATNDFFPIPLELYKKHPHSYMLRVKGESMNRVLPNGSFALVDPDAAKINDKVYVLSVNRSEATVKRVRFHKGRGFELLPDSTDDSFKPQFYGKGGIEEPVRVLGQVVWYCPPFDLDL